MCCQITGRIKGEDLVLKPFTYHFADADTLEELEDFSSDMEVMLGTSLNAATLVAGRSGFVIPRYTDAEYCPDMTENSGSTKEANDLARLLSIGRLPKTDIIQ